MVGAVKKWQKSDPQNSKDTWIKCGSLRSVDKIKIGLMARAKKAGTTYITQIDNHIAELTVRETMDFSARCVGEGFTEIVRRWSNEEQELLSQLALLTSMLFRGSDDYDQTEEPEDLLLRDQCLD
ncbi:hypothetical protein Tco_0749781 [Tanacetum coccineum]|uniref:Uncharacterized protein n=1 Tax=Tanacetum coccineum TaxID=301880 RepID=A0ABQ4Z0F0_9ASTR